MLESLARDRVIVAIDCGRDRAIELADEMKGHARWLKVGMTLFYAEGPSIVREFKERGFKVFLDLKFYDIPHQVRGAARSAALAGADHVRARDGFGCHACRMPRGRRGGCGGYGSLFPARCHHGALPA